MPYTTLYPCIVSSTADCMHQHVSLMYAHNFVVITCSQALVALANMCNNDINRAHLGGTQAIQLALNTCRYSTSATVATAAADFLAAICLQVYVHIHICITKHVDALCNIFNRRMCHYTIAPACMHVSVFELTQSIAYICFYTECLVSTCFLSESCKSGNMRSCCETDSTDIRGLLDNRYG
jgi:hypothetical protein